MASGRRATASTLGAALLVLALAGSADAKSLDLNFDRATARPGRWVLPPPGNYTTASWCPVRACGSASRFVAGALWGAPWTGKPGDVIRVMQ